MIKSFLVIAAVAACFALTGANVINCTNEDECPRIITCNEGEACTVNCSGDQSCQQRIIDCPDSAACTINCHEDQVCQQTKFVKGTGNFELSCNGEESCEESYLSGTCDTGSCSISCSGHEACDELFCLGSACPSGSRTPPPEVVYVEAVKATTEITCDYDHECPDTIKCTDGQDCSITCNGFQVCSERTIRCPQGGACNLVCNEWQSCEESKFDLNGATFFNATCNGWEACEESLVSGTCDTGNCHISCIGGPEPCDELVCKGSACPHTSKYLRKRRN